jgi:hypothetical protein
MARKKAKKKEGAPSPSAHLGRDQGRQLPVLKARVVRLGLYQVDGLGDLEPEGRHARVEAAQRGRGQGRVRLGQQGQQAGRGRGGRAGRRVGRVRAAAGVHGGGRHVCGGEGAGCVRGGKKTSARRPLEKKNEAPASARPAHHTSKKSTRLSDNPH